MMYARVLFLLVAAPDVAMSRSSSGNPALLPPMPAQLRTALLAASPVAAVQATKAAPAPTSPVQEGAKIAPFGKEDTAAELQNHAAKTQDTLVDAVENAEVAEIKRAVFRALTR